MWLCHRKAVYREKLKSNKIFFLSKSLKLIMMWFHCIFGFLFSVIFFIIKKSPHWFFFLNVFSDEKKMKTNIRVLSVVRLLLPLFVFECHNSFPLFFLTEWLTDVIIVFTVFFVFVFVWPYQQYCGYCQFDFVNLLRSHWKVCNCCCWHKLMNFLPWFLVVFRLAKVEIDYDDDTWRKKKKHLFFVILSLFFSSFYVFNALFEMCQFFIRSNVCSGLFFFWFCFILCFFFNSKL